MLPKRWRGHLMGDEAFQDQMLADFRKFLNAEDNRLGDTYFRFLDTIYDI